MLLHFVEVGSRDWQKDNLVTFAVVLQASVQLFEAL